LPVTVVTLPLPPHVAADATAGTAIVSPAASAADSPIPAILCFVFTATLQCATAIG
jgi:hypothetical protein